MALDASGTPQSSKLYMPYGGWRWGSGNLPTARQFTGQVADATSGLDYYNARYYDPALGQFVAADTVLDGLNRYAYTGNNPTTNVDPSGHDWFSDAWNNTVNVVGQALDFVTGYSASISDVQTLTDDKASLDDKIVAGADLTLNVVTDVALLTGVGEGLRALDLGAKAADMGVHALERMGDDTLAHGTETAASDLADAAATQTASDATDKAGASAATDAGGGGEGGGCSFRADTPVATPSGEQAIGSLKVGDAVTAYDPATKTSSTQTVQQVFVNHDTDLLDVTLRADATVTPSEARLARAPLEGEAAGRAPPQGTTPTATAPKPATSQAHDETVHTTANHPWLTADRGWVEAGTLRAGERVVRADGSTAAVVSLRIVPGTAPMWDLTVSQVHTFVVGATQVVVHNCGSPQPNDIVKYGDKTPGLENHHGVMDAWAKNNVPGYVSRAPDAPTIALTHADHAATNTVYAQWKVERIGTAFGPVDLGQRFSERRSRLIRKHV